MALLFAVGSTCFLVGPFPGYVELVGPGADAVTFFVGSLFFTAGGAVQTWLAFPRARRGVVGRRDPVRRHGVLQLHDLPRAGHVAARTRPTTRSSGAPTRSGRSASWSRARSPSGYRRGGDGGRRAAAPAGGGRRSTSSGCILFGSPPSPATSSRDRLDAPPGGRELDDVGGGGVLLRLRRRHAAQRPHEQVPAPASGACAGAGPGASG